MKLQDTTTVQHNMVNTGQYSIKNSEKMFRILSSQLYSNPIRAIVRELSTNACDAHILSKRIDEQFDVTLPSSFASQFIVRDYGPGLTHDQVSNIFTTYGESTKEHTNDFNGALGLGSKSPFGYTSTYSVRSYINGKVTTYTMYMVDGLPQFSQGETVATTAPNGLEIIVPVKMDDVQRFRNEAAAVLPYFERPPRVNGTTIADELGVELQLTPVATTETLALYAFASGAPKSRAYTSDTLFRMSNVMYPFNISSWYEAVQNDRTVDEAMAARLNKIVQQALHHIRSKSSNNTLLIDVPNGALTFLPNREELSYDTSTCRNITKMLMEIVDSIAGSVKDVLDEADKLPVDHRIAHMRNHPIFASTNTTMRQGREHITLVLNSAESLLIGEDLTTRIREMMKIVVSDIASRYNFGPAHTTSMMCLGFDGSRDGEFASGWMAYARPFALNVQDVSKLETIQYYGTRSRRTLHTYNLHVDYVRDALEYFSSDQGASKVKDLIGKLSPQTLDKTRRDIVAPPAEVALVNELVREVNAQLRYIRFVQDINDVSRGNALSSHDVSAAHQTLLKCAHIQAAIEELNGAMQAAKKAIGKKGETISTCGKWVWMTVDSLRRSMLHTFSNQCESIAFDLSNYKRKLSDTMKRRVLIKYMQDHEKNSGNSDRVVLLVTPRDPNYPHNTPLVPGLHAGEVTWVDVNAIVESMKSDAPRAKANRNPTLNEVKFRAVAWSDHRGPEYNLIPTVTFDELKSRSIPFVIVTNATPGVFEHEFKIPALGLNRSTSEMACVRHVYLLMCALNDAPSYLTSWKNVTIPTLRPHVHARLLELGLKIPTFQQWIDAQWAQFVTANPDYRIALSHFRQLPTVESSEWKRMEKICAKTGPDFPRIAAFSTKMVALSDEIKKSVAAAKWIRRCFEAEQYDFLRWQEDGDAKALRKMIVGYPLIEEVSHHSLEEILSKKVTRSHIGLYVDAVLGSMSTPTKDTP